jgi:hypothetical protein
MRDPSGRTETPGRQTAIHLCGTQTFPAFTTTSALREVELTVLWYSQRRISGNGCRRTPPLCADLINPFDSSGPPKLA